MITESYVRYFIENSHQFTTSKSKLPNLKVIKRTKVVEQVNLLLGSKKITIKGFNEYLSRYVKANKKIKPILIAQVKPATYLKRKYLLVNEDVELFLFQIFLVCIYKQNLLPELEKIANQRQQVLMLTDLGFNVEVFMN